MGLIQDALHQIGTVPDYALTRQLEREPAHLRKPSSTVIVRRLVGLDIGQRNDWTALAVIDEAEDDSLTLVALQRVNHKPYPEVARLVADTMQSLTGMDEPTLLVDVTGVGRPVTDQLDELYVRHERINIHGGSAVTKLDDGTVSVPKRDLISALVVGFESGSLRIAAGLKHAATLEAEAAAFTMKLSVSGHDTYNAREGEHDDLLLAVALPVWWAKKNRPVQFFFL